ncbi:MAG: heavy metal translocating P-type ATPase [Tepidisphaeraceae bacterium]|jgi:P-type Cu2+ transporter
MTTLATEILAASPPATAPVPCSHCGQDVPRGLVEVESQLQFCCAGCRAVYDAIHACGLEAYYRLRNAAVAPPKPSESTFESFDAPAFHKLFVQQQSQTVASVDLMLEGVTCAACVWLIERLPHVLPGVIEARLSLRQAIVRVTWNTRELSLSRIGRTLNGLGYTPHPAKGLPRKQLARIEVRKRLIDLAVAGAIAGNAMLVACALYAGRGGRMEDSYREFFRWISAVLGILSLAWPGAGFFRGAIAAVRLRTVNFDVPIVLGLLAGGVAGIVNVILNRGEVYFDSLSVLVFLLLVGRFLQFRQQRRADDAVELLFCLAPSTCRTVRQGDRIEEMPIEAVVSGDLIEVLSGQTIAADGVVESGQSHVLQALLTGEAEPVPVGVGDKVYGGVPNQGASLRIRVSQVGADSRVGRLMRVVERGVAEKPAIVQFTDRIAARFVLVVTLAAAGTFAYWSRFDVAAAVDHAVALLIVCCPCVLGLATPVTLAVAIGRLARRDILVKSGAAIEKLARRGQILLDKTGTLTFGQLRLVCWHVEGFASTGDEQFKPLVAALERQSQHPVARAFCQALAAFELPAAQSALLHDVKEQPNGGIRAMLGSQAVHVGSPAFVNRAGISVPPSLARLQHELEQVGTTVVLVAVDGNAVALAGFGDQIRDDSRWAVHALHELDWDEQILSGDSQSVVRKVARAVGIDPSRATGEMTPEAKLALVREYQGRCLTVMVGDGVNDAAALAAADVGIAVHGGAEASLAAADVYIASPGLTPLVHLVTAARKTMRTIRVNLAISLVYNLVAAALAATGKMSPLICAILMPVSSATVLSLAMASIRRIDRKTPRNAEDKP